MFRQSVDQPCNEAVHLVHVAKNTLADQPATAGIRALKVEGDAPPVEVGHYLAEREVGHVVPHVELHFSLPDCLVR